MVYFLHLCIIIFQAKRFFHGCVYMYFILCEFFRFEGFHRGLVSLVFKAAPVCSALSVFGVYSVWTTQASHVAILFSLSVILC